MSAAWLKVGPYCWLRTGSAGLLPGLGNPPIRHTLMAATPTHTGPLKDPIEASDPHGNCRERIKPGNDFLNPHSAVATNQPPSPRPRGFLP